MEPAYRNGDRLLVNRLAYMRHAPTIGDVVVLRDPSDRSRFLLKRVAPPPPGTARRSDAVYVLGDNAAESRDSREFGAVPRSHIVGRAWRKY
jgi:signal peptidase I